jgi:hypothetical protein
MLSQASTARGRHGACCRPATRHFATLVSWCAHAPALVTAARAPETRPTSRPAPDWVSRPALLSFQVHIAHPTPGSLRSWSVWSDTTACTAPLCGNGTIGRTRSCVGDCGECEGPSANTTACDNEGKPTVRRRSERNPCMCLSSPACRHPIIVVCVGVLVRVCR